MRRAILAAGGTVVGLVALLGYKSGGAGAHSPVPVPVLGGAAAPGPPAASPSTAAAPPTASATASPPAGAATAAAPASYTGEDVQYNYGDIAVQIALAGERITAITIPQESATDNRSESINSQAIPILTQEALAAQNLKFDVVSGATFTSEAFAQSLQSALAKAGR